MRVGAPRRSATRVRADLQSLAEPRLHLVARKDHRHERAQGREGWVEDRLLHDRRQAHAQRVVRRDSHLQRDVTRGGAAGAEAQDRRRTHADSQSRVRVAAQGRAADCPGVPGARGAERRGPGDAQVLARAPTDRVGAAGEARHAPGAPAHLRRDREAVRGRRGVWAAPVLLRAAAGVPRARARAQRRGGAANDGAAGRHPVPQDHPLSRSRARDAAAVPVRPVVPGGLPPDNIVPYGDGDWPFFESLLGDFSKFRSRKCGVCTDALMEAATSLGYDATGGATMWYWTLPSFVSRVPSILRPSGMMLSRPSMLACTCFR
mmetsp:Transcript_31374/g.99989  ORF Transcript_31374/g.99989 Transcript_31374/m.99989 type:complete len:319 (+) Transcript_31374:80-1036(+)